MDVTALDEGADHPYQPLGVKFSLPASDEKVVMMRVPFAIMSVGDLLANIGYSLMHDAEWGYIMGAPSNVIRALICRSILYRPGDNGTETLLSSIGLGPEETVYLLLKEPSALEQGAAMACLPQLQWCGSRCDLDGDGPAQVH